MPLLSPMWLLLLLNISKVNEWINKCMKNSVWDIAKWKSGMGHVCFILCKIYLHNKIKEANDSMLKYQPQRFCKC